MNLLSKFTGGRLNLSRLGQAKGEAETLLEVAARRRPPRLVFVAESASELARLREGLFGTAHLGTDGGAGDRASPWRTKTLGEDHIEVLELDFGASAATEFRVALDHAEADAIVVLTSASSDAAAERTLLAMLDAVDSGEETPPTLVLVVDGADERGLEARKRLRDAMHGVGYRAFRIFIQREADAGFADSSLAALSDALIEETSLRVRLTLCRILPHGRRAREEMANRLVDAVSAVTMAVALTPIPLADAAVITPLQAFMVGTIGYLSGRSMDRKTLAEAFASLGVVGAAGFGFRLVSRQVVKIVPGAGSAVAAGIASSGTKALGKAAMAYFLKPRVA
jgi:uncharacterized protein (DUF697 family)